MSDYKQRMRPYRYTIGSNDEYFTLKDGVHKVDAVFIVVGLLALACIALWG